MMRRNSVWVLVSVCAAALLVVGGCSKKKDKDAPAKAPDKMAAEADDQMAPADPMKPAVDQPKASDPAAPAGRAGALPVGFDQPLIHVDLKALRATELFKKYEPMIKGFLTKQVNEQPIVKALIEKCKFDPMTTLESVTASMTPGGKAGGGLAIIKGTFETAKLLECAKTEATAAQMAPAALTLAGKTGLSFKMKDGEKEIALHVLAMDGASLLFFNEEQKERVEAVLSGKVGSIEDTAFYKEMNGQVKAGVTVFSGLLPKMPESLGSIPGAAMLRNLKGAGLMVGFPEGGLDLKLAVNVGDEKQAAAMAGMIQSQTGQLKMLSPALGEVAQKLQIKADGTWMRASLVLDKTAFEGLMTMVTGLLKDRMGGLLGGKAEEKPADDAMNAGDGMKAGDMMQADDGMKADGMKADGMKAAPRPADMK